MLILILRKISHRTNMQAPSQRIGTRSSEKSVADCGLEFLPGLPDR